MQHTDLTYWDQRYATEDYVFGTEPSQFLKTHARRLAADDDVLMLADGEGRNSVHLAQRGLNVTAFDMSDKALAKARRLAAARGARVNFRKSDITQYDWDARAHDAVIGIFFQFVDPDVRPAVFDGILRATRPGGLIMLHGYTPKQLEYGTGGPKNAANLYTRSLLEEAFAGHEILELEEYETTLNEGGGHSGPSALIDLVVRRA